MTDRSTPDFAPPDFAATWQSFTNIRHRGARTDAEDRAMWARLAPEYDARTGFSDELLALLQASVQPGDTVLDVGAGTGRMTLPLARLARHVTALDHAPGMLAVLRDKLAAAGLTNVTTVEAEWQTAGVAPHDVVIAIWSLYRQPDILAALRKLVAATRRTLIIADGDSGLRPAHEAPHAAHAAAIWGGTGGLPNYLYMAGMLWQIGVRADVRLTYEARHFHGATPAAVARQLAPAYATPAEVVEFTAALEPLLSQDAQGYHYGYTAPVGVVSWTRCAPLTEV